MKKKKEEEKTQSTFKKSNDLIYNNLDFVYNSSHRSQPFTGVF